MVCRIRRKERLSDLLLVKPMPGPCNGICLERIVWVYLCGFATSILGIRQTYCVHVCNSSGMLLNHISVVTKAVNIYLYLEYT